MAFNAKTYPYTEYAELVLLMDQAVLKLMQGAGTLYIPVGSKEQARNIQHTCHRIRAAMRAQRIQDDSKRFDSLLLQLVELEGEKPYGLKVTARGSDIEELDLKLYNAAGQEV